MKSLIFKLLNFTPLLLLPISLFILNVSDKKVSNDNEAILNYQIDKIRNSSDVKTVFFGDSSCGNAIDASYFTQLSGMKTINLSLTASFGISPLIHLSEYVAELNPETKNFIFQISPYALDTVVKPEAHHFILIRTQRLKIFENFSYGLLQEIFSPKNIWNPFEMGSYEDSKRMRLDLKNDYLIQGNDNNSHSSRADLMFPAHKLEELSELDQYCCSQKGRSCLFIFGPNQISLSSQHIKDWQKQMAPFQCLQFVPPQASFDKSWFGDSVDHIDPSKKKVTTEIFYQQLKGLIGNSI